VRLHIWRQLTAAYDLDFLHRFAKAFPTSTLTDFIDDYCRLFKLPLPEPEEDEAEEAGKETADGDKTAEKVKYKRPRRGKNKGVNSRERRKARRLAERDGHLAEDVDEEEREELIASMTVSFALFPSFKLTTETRRAP
jgi:superkiller protein 3